MAVVVDSGAALPSDLSQRPLVHVVPMLLNIHGRAYRDGEDLSRADFYRMLKSMHDLPKTSTPSPADFLQAFRLASQSAESLVCLTVSPRFSASHDSAGAAAAEAAQALPGLGIRVLDTQSAAGGQALVATAAWRAAASGASLDQVVEAAERVIARVSLFAFVDTLYYLWKGGRVPMLAHFGASLLRVKPLFEMARGEIISRAQPRTRRNAVKKLLDLTAERAGDGALHATVMHADGESEANAVKRELEARHNCKELFVSEFSPVMGAHTGPGLLGIALWVEE